MVLLKNCMLAVALIVGVSGAFVSKAANSGKVDDPKYNWTGSGPLHSGGLNNMTVNEAQGAYGCKGTTIPCASGELFSGSGLPNVQIFQN